MFRASEMLQLNGRTKQEDECEVVVLKALRSQLKRRLCAANLCEGGARDAQGTYDVHSTNWLANAPANLQANQIKASEASNPQIACQVQRSLGCRREASCLRSVVCENESRTARKLVTRDSGTPPALDVCHYLGRAPS